MLLRLIIFGCIVLGFTDSSFGQRFYEVKIDKKRDGTKQLEQMVTQFKSAVKFQLKGLQNELQSVVKLNEKQTSKLNIALKGATLSYVKKQEKKARDFFQRQVVAKKLTDNDRKKYAQQDKEGNPRAQAVFGWDHVFPVPIRFDDPSRVVDSKIWNNTIQKVLSKEQLQKYNSFRTEKKSKLTNQALDHFMTRVQLSIHLNKEQKRQVRKAVKEKFGEVLYGNLLLGDPIGARPPFGARIPRYESFVESILSEDQLSEWRLRVVPELFGLETNVANGR